MLNLLEQRLELVNAESSGPTVGAVENAESFRATVRAVVNAEPSRATVGGCCKC